MTRNASTCSLDLAPSTLIKRVFNRISNIVIHMNTSPEMRSLFIYLFMLFLLFSWSLQNYCCVKQQFRSWSSQAIIGLAISNLHFLCKIPFALKVCFEQNKQLSEAQQSRHFSQVSELMIRGENWSKNKYERLPTPTKHLTVDLICA